MDQTASETGSVDANERTKLVQLSAGDMPAILRFSESLKRFVDRIGRFGAWFAMPMILITAFDLAVRKTGVIQIWLVENVSEYFGSTLLQELEWHAHTVLFTLVLGGGYVWNTHVRVDLVREKLAFRKKAWIEFIGLSIFLLPFTAILIYFAVIYAYDSWAINRPDDCPWYQCGEISASLVGLSHRWIIKTVMAFGFIIVLVAGIAVWIEMAVVLFGPRHWRFPLATVEWPEDEGDAFEGKDRMILDADGDVVDEGAVIRKEKEALDGD